MGAPAGGPPHPSTTTTAPPPLELPALEDGPTLEEPDIDPDVKLLPLLLPTLLARALLLPTLPEAVPLVETPPVDDEELALLPPPPGVGHPVRNIPATTPRTPPMNFDMRVN